VFSGDFGAIFLIFLKKKRDWETLTLPVFQTIKEFSEQNRG